jgi:hypothetical protein
MDIRFEGKYNKMGDNIIADLYKESIVKSSYIVLFCSIFFSSSNYAVILKYTQSSGETHVL